MEVENGAFVFNLEGGHEIRQTPYAYIPNLVRKVADLLTHKGWSSLLA